LPRLTAVGEDRPDTDIRTSGGGRGVRSERGEPVARSRSGAAALTVALAVLAVLVLAASAFGASDHRVVEVEDDCDPATFNAAVGPGTCVGDGQTLFQELLDQFGDTGAVDKWDFSRPEFGLDAGGTIEVRNEGGEFHTFTEVDEFGNGCSPLDNGEPPAVDCVNFEQIAVDSGLVPGETRVFSGFEPGSTVKFECLIHPWMRSTVEVEPADDDHNGQG
jgi:hypothetical protein